MQSFTNIDKLFSEGYLKLEVNIRSDGIEIIDMSSGQATFSPGFSATLTNTITGEVYYDQSCGCRFQLDASDDHYKFTGGGFMENCNIMAIGKSYKVGLIDPFITLITHPPELSHISCADIGFVFCFLVVMYSCIWMMKQVN
jgi:hypothetical protein